MGGQELSYQQLACSRCHRVLLLFCSPWRWLGGDHKCKCEAMCRHIIIKDHYNSSNHFTTVKNHGDRWLDQWQQQVFCSVRLNFRVTTQLNHAGKILRKSNKMIRRSWITMANHKRAKWIDALDTVLGHKLSQKYRCSKSTSGIHAGGGRDLLCWWATSRFLAKLGLFVNEYVIDTEAVGTTATHQLIYRGNSSNKAGCGLMLAKCCKKSVFKLAMFRLLISIMHVLLPS